MATTQVPLAKISRPRLHDVLARTRLFGALDDAVRRPVAWLSAQPGAGKTALVAGWLEARKRSGIWYQVDAGDADPASFVYHLGLAAHGAAAALELPLLTPEYMQDLSGFARRFFRALFAGLGSGAALVLDNFQEAPDDAAFHKIVIEGLAEVPDGINVIVLSRADPPAEYATLLAADAIALLDAGQLRLTLQETKGIAKKRGVTDAAVVEALHARSAGWAAGLTLLLARTRRGGDAADDDAESMQHVFGYFAQRVFDNAVPEAREALLALAFVPVISVPLARGLTAMDGIERLLDHYYKRHLFTERRRLASSGAAAKGTGAAPGSLPDKPVPAPAGGYVYQFHALFRTFLQHQARASWSGDALRDVVRRAARLLEDEGDWEHALDLHAEAGDWDRYGDVLAAHSEALIDQGRRQTVLDRLAQMPADERARRGWLGYWEARALAAQAPDRALALLQSEYERFVAARDVAAQLVCGGAIVQTLWDARLGWSEITHWVDRIEPLMREPVEFPSPQIELLTTAALHAALTFCAPAHPAIQPLAQKLLALVDDAAIPWNTRLSTATHLMVFFHNAADHERATQLLGKVDAAVEKRPASALVRAFWYIFRAMHDLRLGNYDVAAAQLQQAEDIGRGEGLAQVEYAAMQFRVYLDTLFRHDDDAEARLARMERHPARANADGHLHYNVCRMMLAQRRGDAAAALEHAEQVLAIVERIKAAYFQMVFPVLACSALADAGEHERALGILAAARDAVRGTYLDITDAQLALEEAYVRLSEDDAAAARTLLAEGFARAAADRSRAGYTHRILARKPALLVAALEAGIEVEFVRRLIRRWRIPAPPHEPAAWPWPIRVYTLGRFEVLVDDAPIEFGRKAPRKTLALLKAIVARGGSAPEGVLQDTFWPSEAGDVASRSLGAAVHRLRGLLSDGDAVIQQGGKVALDAERVWVDAWAFERGLADARDRRAVHAATDRATHVPAHPAALLDALQLYRGAFLVEEEGEPWPVPMRERLRSKFVQAVADHAAGLEHAHRYEEAIGWYLRGLDADSVVEPFYQGLMRCYHRLDRLPEAVGAYRRLKQTLSITLSLPPSAGTEKLYQTLRLGA
jgi:ATP/maltotriose-dependent transcriptional regulator MalT/DNA-binding SARP family transcriptional activator